MPEIRTGREPDKSPALRRSLGPLAVSLYGIGTIIGAGIFVLLGKLIGVSGNAAPYAFLLAAAIAAITGLSYARLADRFPFSAGEAVYADSAFKLPWLTVLVGLAVAGSGVLSAATIAKGFAGYLNVLVEIPTGVTAVIYLLVLGGVAISGIRETAWLIGLIAIVSTIGLIGLGVFIVHSDADWKLPELELSLSAITMAGILLGASLAFYALIGFEDLVNLAEEIRDPGRTLSIAIPVSLGFATLVYVGLAIVALGAAPIHELASTDAPMAFLLSNSGLPGQNIIVILSIVAITNGAMAQLVMASRVLYGLANQALLPQLIAQVNARTRTPIVASIIVITLTVVAITSGDILGLARGTSGLVLMVFTLVNLSLLVLNFREGRRQVQQNFLPFTGMISCMLLLTVECLRIAGVLVKA